MNGCIYRTKDGECDLFAEGGKYTAFCEMENCEGRKMSNADRIRSMSDEELANILFNIKWGIDNLGPAPNATRCAWENWIKEEVKE